MNAVTPITVRPLTKPQYVPAETYEAWIKLNAELVHDRWCGLQIANGLDPDKCEYADLLAFAKCQFDITHRHVSGVSLRSSVAVLEADTSGESCRESSPTMEDTAAGRADDHSVCSRLAHVTGSESPTSAATVRKPLSQDKNEVTTAGIGTADAGIPYPVTCRARYYEAASRILEEEGQLFGHDNCNELGALIEQWINDARDNWEPR